MGLSEEERVEKVVWAANQMVDLGRRLKKETKDEYSARSHAKRIAKLCAEIPHALYGGRSNGAFWLLGGELGNEVRSHGGPWSSAIMFQCEKNCPSDEGRFVLEDTGWDPMSVFSEENLLKNPWQKTAYQLYNWVEALSYAVRRYDDKLRRKNFKELDRLISNLSAEFFALFNSTEDFAKAYVAGRIFNELFKGFKYVKVESIEDITKNPSLGHFAKDPVFVAIHASGMSSIRNEIASGARDASLKQLIELDRWRLQVADTADNKLVLLFRIAGRHFKYDHKFRALSNALSGTGVRVSRLAKEFEKCKVAAAKHEESETKRYGFEKKWKREGLSAIHGYSWTSDFLRKKEPQEE